MKWMRVALIVFVAIIITALGIDAADTITGSRGTLLSNVIGQSDTHGCPEGMSAVSNVGTVTCVDIYEVSTSETCPFVAPENTTDSMKNIESADCLPVTKPDVMPWRYVTRDQAMSMCARIGKRLPTNDEWYHLSLGVAQVHDTCNISSKQASKTGSFEQCVSPQGAYDMVGNVWEWVSDDVIEGMYNDHLLPDTGYVAQVDGTGMPIVTSTEEQALFGNDYFWSKNIGAYGVLRGGYYDSGTDAGIYAVHADTVPTSASAGIGFRCVQ